MDKNLTSIWNGVLGIVETEISKANFLTFFKNTALLSLNDTTATIAAPSAIIINFIQKRFSHLLKKAIDKHTGKDLKIVLIPKTIENKSNSSQINGPLFQPQEFIKKESPTHLSRVRPDYTFQTLAVSSSNQLAFVSAQTVAKNIGGAYNPLFIYGPVGVGKTHLMQAVANEVFRQDPSRKIIYTTSEEFTNEVVEAIRTNDTSKMKKRFRTATLLLMDDIQFIAGKDRVQEELFHTFNILIDNGSQIVLSSDRPPHEIKKLETRLSSRFSGGLTVDIETPDFELRTAILLIKAKKFGIDLSIDVAKTIAEKTEDTRSLEGLLLRVITQAKTGKEELTSDFASQTLSIHKKEQNHLHPEDVVSKVCVFYNIKPTQIKGPKRDASLVRARQITMYVLKKELGLSLVEIGNLLGGRDHTTVIHGVEKIESLASSQPNILDDILGITKTLRG